MVFSVQLRELDRATRGRRGEEHVTLSCESEEPLSATGSEQVTCTDVVFGAGPQRHRRLTQASDSSSKRVADGPAQRLLRAQGFAASLLRTPQVLGTTQNSTGVALDSTGVALCAAKRGVILLPGLGNNDADYATLAAYLAAEQGLVVRVAPVARIDWSRNALALSDSNWWKGTLKPRPAVDW
eukprot:gene10648-12328_t